MKKYYSGIGSRQSPNDILDFMTNISKVLNSKGYILRSGGAKGADTAFELGSEANNEIFRPSHATNEAIKIAMEVHPAPHNCKDYVKKLHGRNVQIILGEFLDSPADFVICWTPNGKEKGGTGLGIKLAKKYNIKIYNLFNEIDRIELVKRFINEK